MGDKRDMTLDWFLVALGIRPGNTKLLVQNYFSAVKCTCLYVRVRKNGDCDLLPGSLEWARAETGGLTKGRNSGGDLQDLPGCSDFRFLGIPTISVQYIYIYVIYIYTYIYKPRLTDW